MLQSSMTSILNLVRVQLNGVSKREVKEHCCGESQMLVNRNAIVFMRHCPAFTFEGYFEDIHLF